MYKDILRTHRRHRGLSGDLAAALRDRLRRRARVDDAARPRAARVTRQPAARRPRSSRRRRRARTPWRSARVSHQKRRTPRPRSRRHPRVRQRPAALVAVRLLRHHRLRRRVPRELPRAADAVVGHGQLAAEYRAEIAAAATAAAPAPDAGRRRRWLLLTDAGQPRERQAIFEGSTNLCHAVPPAGSRRAGRSEPDGRPGSTAAPGRRHARTSRRASRQGHAAVRQRQPLTDEEVLAGRELRALEARHRTRPTRRPPIRRATRTCELTS